MCKLNQINKYYKCFIIFTILNYSVINTLHSQQFNHFLSRNINSQNIGSNELKKDLNKTLEEAITKKDTDIIVNKLILLSNVSRASLNYGKAFDYAGEALFIAQQSKNSLLLANANEEYGILCYLFNQDTQAGKSFIRSHQFYLKAFNHRDISINVLHRSYYNLLLYYQKIKNRQKTQAYIDTCQAISDTADIAGVYNIFLMEKKATLCDWKKDYTASYNLLNKAINKIEHFKVNSTEALRNKDFLTILYARIGIYYTNKNNFLDAKKFFDKALTQKNTYGEYTFYKEYIYKKYADMLFKIGDFKSAYLNSQKSGNILDKYLNPRNKDVQNFISLKDRYSDELRNKNNKINKQQLELAINRQKIMRLQIIFIVFVFILLVSILILILRKRKTKYQKEKLISEKRQIESKKALNHKNKELTTSLLQLVEKEGIIKKLSTELKSVADNSKTQILLKTIEQQSGNLWDSFNSRFIEQNEDFYKHLKMICKELSPNDLKICALIKLNFSGKEMAYLLGISHGSVNVARHRLRKKMNINKDIRLSDYINSL